MATTPSSGLVAVVKIHGKVVDTYALEELGSHFEKTYHPDKGQYNIVEVDGDSIRVREDNSPDQIAVKTGWINQRRTTRLSVCHMI
ncbi:NusG domain II-containing protein [Streptococcus pluranimalium]|uniref:NusG domain II-containing protein n=1 Tax=Streptococcus pluranimalium TaxID=82348 RepID=UPI003F68F7F1